MILDRLSPVAFEALHRTLLTEHDGAVADEAALLRELLRRLETGPHDAAARVRSIVESVSIAPGNGRRDVNTTLVRLARSRQGPLSEVDVAVALLTSGVNVPAALRAAGHDPDRLAALLRT